MNSKKISSIIQYINENRVISNKAFFVGGGIKLKRKIYKLLLKYECKKNGAFIPATACIGQNICFPHGIIGIFISQGAQIGENATIFHQVTIGSNTLKDSKNFGAPKIGNNVYIGAGAKIIGGVTIGDNVRIGANAVVTSNIPANATVVLERPRILEHLEQRNNEFRKFIQ